MTSMELSRRHATLAGISAISGIFLTGRAVAQQVSPGGSPPNPPPPSPGAQNIFDYAIPFDIMVGRWMGMAYVYGPDGYLEEELSSTVTNIVAYWKSKPVQLYYRESSLDPATDFARMKFVRQRIRPLSLTSYRKLFAFRPEYLLQVQGSTCDGDSNDGTVTVHGVRTHPDKYEFHLVKHTTGHNVYNTHRFPSPNEWHVSGMITDSNGNPGAVVEQTFRRIAYDVPPEWMS